MKKIQTFKGRCCLMSGVFAVLMLIGVGKVHAQEAKTSYQVRSGESISAKIQTLEIVYVLEADIDDLDQVLDLNLYPNPSTTQLNVNIGQNGEISQLHFYTKAGTRVMVPQLSSTVNSSSYDVSRLPGGMYLVVIELVNGERVSRKIIKN